MGNEVAVANSVVSAIDPAVRSRRVRLGGKRGGRGRLAELLLGRLDSTFDDAEPSHQHCETFPYSAGAPGLSLCHHVCH